MMQTFKMEHRRELWELGVVINLATGDPKKMQRELRPAQSDTPVTQEMVHPMLRKASGSG
jgi:hypothetical protein